MTFHAQAQVAGREIVRIVELVVPRCALRYGNLPCTAGARAVAHPNLIQQSEVFSGGWNQGGIGALVLSSYIAPNSTMTGVIAVDSNAGAGSSISYQASADPLFAEISGTSAWLEASIHVLKKSAPEPTTVFRMTATGAVSSIDCRMAIDALTGCWSASAPAGQSIVKEGRVIDCGSWWRMRFIFNLAACTNLQSAVFPATAAAGTLSIGVTASFTGSVGLWGAMVRQVTSSAGVPPYLSRGVESQWLTTGLSQACYNTANTCQDLANYLQGEQSIFFIDERVSQPQGFEGFPALVDVDLSPSRLNPQMGLGDSAKLTVKLRDFPYDDRGTDPYVDARSYTPSSQGTFFGRLFARDPYIQGKKIRYYEGYYAGSGTFTFSHYLVREFIVDEFDRPDSRGRLRIRGTDILRLTNEDRSLCPIPSTATLQGNLTATHSVFFMASSAAAAYLASDPHIRIDEELILLATQTGCSWTTVRGAGLTEAAVHSAGSVVQVCKTYSYMNVCSIAMDQIVNFASIPSSYIPVNSWDAEKTATLDTYNLYNIISEPTAVRDILDEVMRACDLSLWYDEVASKIALRHQSPWTVSFMALSDSGSFISDTMEINARDDIKVSRVGVRYAPTNYIDGDGSRFQLAVNSSREDPRFDGRKSEHTIDTAWLSSSHDALAATIAGRAMLRYSELVPYESKFSLDATLVASVRTGDVVELNTRLLQAVDGSVFPTRMQVIEHGPEQAGHRYSYNALLYQGLTAATSLSIDVSTYNYNVHSAMGGPTSAVRVYLTVNSGIHVGGSGTGQAAITTSGLPAGSVVYLTAIGSSQVLGYAGAKGVGARGNAQLEDGEWILVNPGGGADPGGDGGPALYVAGGVTVYIDVGGGYLLAGGPGGGGGGLDWDGASNVQDGGDGGAGQGFTNSGGPSAPQTAGVVDGGSGAVWGGTALPGANGTYLEGAAAGAQGYAVRLQNASAVYYFVNGYDSNRVKGLVGL